MGMRTVQVSFEGDTPGFETAKALADAVARVLLGESVCLSWYDRPRDRMAPAGTNECHTGCDTPGYLEYAASRGAELRVTVGPGDYVFCYRPVGEFADLDTNRRP